jgi:hypothetical protein
MNDITRFLNYVIIDQTDPVSNCWLFTIGLDKNGYGSFHISKNMISKYKITKKKMIYAHRFSYLIFNDFIPDNLNIRHMCNNPSCVNPFHLKVGTQKENMEDMVKAGRQNKLKGEKHNRAKLKNEQVLEIRALKKSGMRTCDIMKKFSLSKTTVLRIISRRLWKHI